MYGMMLYDIDGNGQENVPFGNQGEILETRTIRRIQPLHFGVNYHAEPLQFKLVFGSDREMGRYDLEAISYWLTGQQQYQWLTIDQPDLMRVQFRCLITQLTPLSFGWLPVAFEATVLCDCPYAYGYPFEKTYIIRGKTDVLLRNDSTVREYLHPDLQIAPSAGTEVFQIINHDDADRLFRISGIPASGASILVDNNNGVIQETTSGYNLYPGFNLNFFRLVHGDNHLEITGDGTVTISGRFLYNVAG